MPTLRNGDMWDVYDQPDTLFCITTNAVLDRKGRLVMGAGIALQARERIPGVESILGRAVMQQGGGSYGLIVPTNFPYYHFAAFQTKIDWRDPASLSVIEKAARLLTAWANAHPAIQIHLPYPGIGCGGLDEAQVWPLIQDLPATVAIWRR